MSEQQSNIEVRSMLPVGTVLNGKYRIDRYLASGGFGNTYAAYNVFLEEEVAVKEFYIRGVTHREGDSVSVSVSNEENIGQFIDQKAKFMKEARRLRRLKNDHIVRVHDLFEENGTAYYIMDFVNGESLSSRLKRTGQPIGEQESLNILGQVLDALAVVHQQGIFHLDIKPANIMVDHEGNALLIDFGASKQMDQKGGATASTGLCYTPGYAPIEQMAQNYNQFGPWTDIYSLGASLYYMLTLHPLPSPADLLENEMLLQMDASVSPSTQQLVRRMMAPVRTQRPQSVAEVKRLMAEKVVDDPPQMVTKPAPPSEMTRTIAQPKSQPQSKLVPPKPVPPKPVPPKPQPAPVYTQTKTSSNYMKWGIPLAICALLFIVGVIGGVFYVMNNRADEPVQPEQTVSADSVVTPQEPDTLIMLPTKPIIPEPTKPVKRTTTTTPSRTTIPTKPSNTNSNSNGGKLSPSNTNSIRGSKPDKPAKPSTNNGGDDAFGNIPNPHVDFDE